MVDVVGSRDRSIDVVAFGGDGLFVGLIASDRSFDGVGLRSRHRRFEVRGTDIVGFREELMPQVRGDVIVGPEGSVDTAGSIDIDRYGIRDVVCIYI